MKNEKFLKRSPTKFWWGTYGARKIKNLLLITLLGSSIFFPLISFSQGLVPCGYDLNGDGVFDPATEGCQLCHFFVMLDNIIDFVFVKLVPPVAVLMLVIGGFLFFFAGSPATLTRAKSIITTTIIGLLIIYAAFLLVGMFLLSIGLANWTTDIYRSWWEEGFFTIDCPT